MSDTFPPQHMDKYTRNERLYNFLLQMGHVVSPIFAEGSTDKIEALHVSAELPVEQRAEQTSVAGVRKAVQGAKVANMVTATESLGDGKVILFPSML